MTACWLCEQPISDPPEIIGHWHASRGRVAHRRCLRVLGEIELSLQLPPDPGETTAAVGGPPDP